MGTRRFALDPRIVADLKTQRGPLIVGLLATALANGLYASSITLTKQATDVIAAISSQIGSKAGGFNSPAMAVNLRQLQWVCAYVVLLFGFRYIFFRAQTYSLMKASNQLAANLRQRLFAKLLKLPVSYFNEKRSGAIQSVLTNDVNVYQNATSLLQDAISGPVKAIGALYVIVRMLPILAPFTLVLIAVLVMIVQRNSRKIKASQAQVQSGLAEMNSLGQEFVQGIRVIKAFGSENQALSAYEAENNATLRQQLISARIFSNFRPLVDLIGAVALAMVIYYSGLLAAHGEVSAGDITALVFAMDVINQGLKNLASIGGSIATVGAATDRIYSQVLDIPEEILHSSNSEVISKAQGKIEFRDVSFTYPDGTEALRGVSFTLNPGESLALVGPSGAGKSTIADLLLRFYEPTGGGIFFDGVNISEISPAQVRNWIGVVPQQTFLFAGSIIDNVLVGNPNATPAEVKAALKSAHAEDFAEQSPVVGERGVKLSGGQMQRVAIARALVRQPLVFLLDEATSALDATSEKIVSDSLSELMESRTTLMIAHRLTTAARADRIVYLRGGTIVESGSHKELMDKNGEYAALFRVFSSGVLETNHQFEGAVSASTE